MPLPVTFAPGQATHRLRRALLAVALAGALLGVAVRSAAPLATAGVVADGLVVALRDVQAQWAQHPQDWLGRTVLVRCIPVLSSRATCPGRTACRAAQATLVDPDPAANGARLPLALGPADPLLARLVITWAERDGAGPGTAG